ncbi:hypothetical protein CDD83_4451 [Cordyceps sp. RAO-2017]|nr:hypothetical protein CDD83_4451 [Cordyceps sp. RAO-2017]
MPSSAAIPFLVGMMLLTGVCNTLLTKYQDNQCVRHCGPDDPSIPTHFEQPLDYHPPPQVIKLSIQRPTSVVPTRDARSPYHDQHRGLQLFRSGCDPQRQRYFKVDD